MPKDIRRLKRSISRNELLDRELDFLSSTISRDDVREIARRYGPLRRRSALGRMAIGLVDFAAKYGAPFAGMLIGAEYRAAQALTPLIGAEQRYGDSLRAFLGQNISQKIEDTNKAFQIAGALIAATPDIAASTLYGALYGIAAYYVLKWFLALNSSFRRRLRLTRKISELLG
ncbi:hypothetical protein HZA56_07105 [Candidatus Poribacteria bacterium]|nr:hypothetical protein [Candidatus Poribacteria bacterium]